MAKEYDQNLDPISKEPGAHPVGTGVGAAVGGAAAGAAAGMVGGPVGAVVGAVAGAVVGGLGGKAVAESVNPTAEEAHWRESYDREPYYEAGRSFDDYGPAYRMGVQARSEYGSGARFDDYEDRLANDWDNQKGGSALGWPEARHASRAAWDRVDSQYYGSDNNPNTMGSSSDMRGVGNMDDLSRTDGLRGGMASGASMRADDLTDSGFRSGTDGGVGATSAMSGSRSDGVADNDDVIDTLNDLLECCRDGEYGFRESAEHAQSSDLRSTLMRHAEECRTAGQELMGLIRQKGGDVDEGGTVTGAMHRGWVSVRGTLSGYSDQAMLDECERGEDAAVARYRKALKQDLPSDVRSVVERQAQGVQRNHDQIKSLRDSLKSSS